VGICARLSAQNRRVNFPPYRPVIGTRGLVPSIITVGARVVNSPSLSAASWQPPPVLPTLPPSRSSSTAYYISSATPVASDS
jgi:hypothetical protein